MGPCIIMLQHDLLFFSSEESEKCKLGSVFPEVMIQNLLYFKCDCNKDWKNYTEIIQHFTARTSPSRQKSCEASSASCWMNRREEKHSQNGMTSFHTF